VLKNCKCAKDCRYFVYCHRNWGFCWNQFDMLYSVRHILYHGKNSFTICSQVIQSYIPGYQPYVNLDHIIIFITQL